MANLKSSCCRTLTVNNQTYHYYSLPAAVEQGLGDLARLPNSLKVLFENLLRHLDGNTVTEDNLKAFTTWLQQGHVEQDIAYRPARVLMQDFTGVPAIVDLAAMRDAMQQLGSAPERINPQIPVDLVIDHSVQVDAFANPEAFAKNVEFEMQRNRERYQFLRWGQQAFANFRVVPPGTGICHQVNLEHLAQVVWTKTEDGQCVAFPDTLVGTDSHTTMINGLGVLGWGVGGIEAEAAMLGQPISMRIPDVVGVKLTGKLREGIIATDLVLTITEMLRQHGVVGKFVEFYGDGLDQLPLADRATIANMAPEYGATCGFFPVDQETLNYLALTGRDEQTIDLVKAYTQAQGLWREANQAEPVFSNTLSLDLATVEASIAGPKRPQDRVILSQLPATFKQILQDGGRAQEIDKDFDVAGENFSLHHGDVVIAAITSCTNTSNPSALIAAGLVAKKAIEKGLTRKPWVKSSLAPGSKVVTDYLEKAGLQTALDQLGFNLVGYGCTTCIGNSGPLPEAIHNTIVDNDLTVSSVLSGNRNFEGRVHPLTKANWLASPALVVAYSIAGTTHIDISQDIIGEDDKGQPVYLKDIWPSNQEIADLVTQVVSRDLFQREYADVFKGDETWQQLTVPSSATYRWQSDSTYVQEPPFFQGLSPQPASIHNVSGARVLALLGDSITTDHISPAGAIKRNSPAGEYLIANEVLPKAFNSFGSRRGNHQVMLRGTFGNIRIRNEMVPGTEGGFTKHIPSGETLSIYDAAMRYQQENTPLVVIAGKEYGTGSSRDWAAKGTRLLGVMAVLAESYERIHRSNLIGMGVLPLEFTDGQTRNTLKLTGEEIIDIDGLSQGLQPGTLLTVKIKRPDGSTDTTQARCRIDTDDELQYYQNGGILSYVLRTLAA